MPWGMEFNAGSAAHPLPVLRQRAAPFASTASGGNGGMGIFTKKKPRAAMPGNRVGGSIRAQGGVDRKGLLV